MEKFLVWFKGVFSTLNQFINNKLLIFEQNDRIKGIFESNAADQETVNTVITMVIDILVVIIFLLVVKKIIGLVYNYLRRRRRRNQQKNQHRKSPQKYGNNAKKTRNSKSGNFRQRKNIKRRRGFITEIFSKLKLGRKKKRKKVKYSYSNECIDDNGKLSYNGYDDDYSYDDYPEEINVQQQHVNHHSRAKNSDGENTMYIPRVENVDQTVYGNQNPNKQQSYRNGYTNNETDIYRAMPRPNVSEYAEDSFDFGSCEQNEDDGKTRVFKRK